jgi:lysozyme
MQPIRSRKTIDLIKSFENFRAKAYLDSAGVPTIGWGTTKEIHLGMTVTQEQAEEWIKQDIAEIENAIAALITLDLEESQFSALVSLVYNIGIHHFSTSTLLKKLNAGDLIGAAREFLKWDHSCGRTVNGLLNRRIKEQELFLTPHPQVKT